MYITQSHVSVVFGAVCTLVYMLFVHLFTCCLYTCSLAVCTLVYMQDWPAADYGDDKKCRVSAPLTSLCNCYAPSTRHSELSHSVHTVEPTILLIRPKRLKRRKMQVAPRVEVKRRKSHQWLQSRCVLKTKRVSQRNQQPTPLPFLRPSKCQ